MATERNLKNQYAEILGRNPESIDENTIIIRESLSLYSFDHGKAVQTVFLPPRNPSKVCEDQRSFLTVSGFSITNANGSKEFLLKDYLCEFTLA